jgi:hypothetical protein
MTSLGEPLVAQLVDPAPTAVASRWTRLDALLIRGSERLNPILVKEARQALRSKQFTVTFFLMLLAGWVWSVVGLASIGPAAYYAAEGPQMFYIYHLILAFPVLVVAPYSAYHSLSSERQDRTYELVCITSLGARQILTGKLGSVALQIIVYMSAIFPCLAFTYLLRGLDIFTILFVVLYTTCLSIGLALFGLLLAAMAPARQRQVIMGVLYTILLFGAFMLDSTWTSGIVFYSGLGFDTEQFIGVNAVLATLYLNYFAIVFLAARSQLLTVSQNRSTALRVALVVAHLSLLGWIAFGMLRWGANSPNQIFTFIFMLSIFWYLAGVFLTGESDVLPPRVKRDLPQTTLGRVFFTWFVPGSGTGYMFVLANMATGSAFLLLPFTRIRDVFFQLAGTNAGVLATSSTARGARALEILATAVIALSYLAIYLGVGRLLLLLIAKVSEVRVTTRVIIHAFLMLTGCGIPWVVQMTTPVWRDQDYLLIQAPNAVWTMYELCDKGLPFELPFLIVVLPLAAGAVWLANLPSLFGELKQARIEKPARMIAEDQELAERAVAALGPQSPWG